MAHIVAYLQRTPQGLHPASAAALCWGRDIASERGASLTAVCRGDAGIFDRGTLAAAARFGADVVLFGGATAMQHLQERLNPAHVLVPWTEEGKRAVADLPTGPVVARWLDRPHPPWTGADAVTGVIAGTLPWHAFTQQLEAEYEGDVDDVELPDWLESGATMADGADPPLFQVAAEGDIGYVAPDGLDQVVVHRLHRLGAHRVTLEEIGEASSGTYVLLQPGAGPLPDVVSHRAVGTRLIVMPGPEATVDSTWSGADWVFAGAWPDVLDQLLGGPWGTAHG